MALYGSPAPTTKPRSCEVRVQRLVSMGRSHFCPSPGQLPTRRGNGIPLLHTVDLGKDCGLPAQGARLQGVLANRKTAASPSSCTGGAPP